MLEFGPSSTSVVSEEFGIVNGAAKGYHRPHNGCYADDEDVCERQGPIVGPFRVVERSAWYV